jgi:CRP/FNR family transcriptional regulator
MSEIQGTANWSAFTDPVAAGSSVQFANGEVIHEQSTAATHVYMIQRGQVRQYATHENGASRLVEILGPDQWFGIAALAGAETYQLRAIAVGTVTAIRVRREDLLAAFAQHPNQLLQLNRELAGKLMGTTREASQFVFEDCNQRLINALIRFSGSAASTKQSDGVVLHLTHDQLAQAVGVARETVSLALTQLRQMNLLRTGRNQLMFNPEALKQFCAAQLKSRVDAPAPVAM